MRSFRRRVSRTARERFGLENLRERTAYKRRLRQRQAEVRNPRCHDVDYGSDQFQTNSTDAVRPWRDPSPFISRGHNKDEKYEVQRSDYMPLLSLYDPRCQTRDMSLRNPARYIALALKVIYMMFILELVHSRMYVFVSTYSNDSSPLN